MTRLNIGATFYERKKKSISTSGVRTHADIRPLELKSNALTTRPSYCDNDIRVIKIYKQNIFLRPKNNNNNNMMFIETYI